MIFRQGPPTRVLAIVAGLLLLASLTFAAISYFRPDPKQARIDKGQTSAVIESGMEASNVQAGIAINDVASADLGRKNAEDIRNAEGSNVVVADPARAAWLRAICKRTANLNRPECRVQ